MAEITIKMDKKSAPILSIPHTRRYAETQVEYKFNVPDEEVEKITTHVDEHSDFNGCMTSVYKRVEKLDKQEAKDLYNQLAQMIIDSDGTV